MSRFWTESRKIAYRVIVILACFQIGIGVAWMAGNLWHVPYFERTKELWEISKTMVTDQYVGILYPALIRLLTALEKLIPIPCHIFLYAAQLVLGYLAVKKLLKELECRYAGVAALWVMTIPTVMQLYLAVLPQAFAVSTLLLCLVSCRRREWAQGAVWWLCSAFLIPEYVWFGGIVYLFYLVAAVETRKERKTEAAEHKKDDRSTAGQSVVHRTLAGRSSVGMAMLCLLVVCLAVTAVNGLTREDYSRGRMHRTFASTMLQRMVWPHYATTSSFWGYEVNELFDEDALRELAQDPQLPVTDFGPVIEKTLGMEKAQSIFANMAKAAFGVRTREIAGDIAADFLGYALPLPALLWHLEGNGATYSGWNYGQMSSETPVLTRYYVQITGRMFGLLLLVCLITEGRNLMKRLRMVKTAQKQRRTAMKSTSGGKESRDRLLPVSIALLCGLFTVWYTFSAAGMMDYMNVMIVSIGWGSWIACRLTGEMSRDTGEETGQC